MKQSLNGCWTAQIGGADYTITVPGAVQKCPALAAEYPSDAMPNGYLGAVTMRKTFCVDKLKKHSQIVLKGVMPYATVFLNDCEIGTVSCSQVAFRFPCTHAVRTGSNELRVEIEEKNLELIGGMRFDVLQWSGIFDEVQLCSFDIETDEPRVELEENELWIQMPVSGEADRAVLEIREDGAVPRTVPGEISQGIASFRTAAESLRLWSVENPALCMMKITVFAGADCEEVSFRTGIRKLHRADKRIYLNGKPLYLFGGGDEYFSPTISPLTDREIIYKRFSAMKKLGFNFYRYHTHCPMQTELEVCDELGLLVSVEIPILSNFGRITDEEMGLQILRTYIRQTRTHPCILCYCLGNEAIQLMVRKPEEQALAEKGDACIRENSTYHFGMFCFGNQGERPQLPGDFLTPHLWSQDFRWAYEGLTGVPWDELPATLDERPAVIHELGKYGIWPDEAEDGQMPQDGYRLRFKDLNDALFSGQEMRHLRTSIIKNGRELSLLCASTLLQAVRRQREISGFVYWTFFTMGIRCGGLCGDMGQIPASAEARLRPATSPVGIYANVDFAGRTFYAGEQTAFSVTVSNFGGAAITDAQLRCTLRDGKRVLREETAAGVRCELGEIAEKMRLRVQMPAATEATALRLHMQLHENGKIIAENQAELWCYPWTKENPNLRAVSFLHDDGTEKDLRRVIGKVTPIWNWISLLLGCEIPEYGFEPTDEKLASYLECALHKHRPEVVISDRMDGTTDCFLKQGVPVLFVDDGGFPAELYAPRRPEGAFFTCNTFYSPFRSSWEEGNGATVLDSELFDGEQGFADLRYFECIEGAMPLLRRQTLDRLGMEKERGALRLFRRVKRQRKTEKEPIYFARTNEKELQDCVYYLDGAVNGTPLAVTSLHLFSDACGQDLLGRILRKLRGQALANTTEER